MAEAVEPLPPERRRLPVRPIVFVAGLVVVALVLWLVLRSNGESGQERFTGYVVADDVYMTSPVAGTLASVSVQRGQRVAAGAALFQIDPTERAAETRSRILDAALKEFSAHGLVGGRMEQIAAVACVNKALLYYYFDSKENLYIAALEMIAGKVRDSSMASFLREGTPGERVLRMALNHFDRILSQNEFQSLMQQEMIRLHKGESGALSVIADHVFKPLQAIYDAAVHEGIASGELIDVDPTQIVLSALGGNVFYFLSAPMWKLVYHEDRLSHKALATRRKILTEFLGQALFTDRALGMKLAQRVLVDTPMPEISPNRFTVRRKDERA